MQSSPTQPHSVLNDSFEWNGVLAEAASKGADFSLLLAMHVSRQETVSFSKEPVDTADQTEKLLESLNSYPPIPISSLPVHVSQIKRQSDLRQRGDFAQAWFEQCAHPNPLHCQKDGKIDDIVIDNCAWATQRYLRKAQEVPTAHTVEADATLLADILPFAEAML
ncbi:hypothetical protein DRW07_08405 [Alteromonas sediminis]|uniref:Uncharacterized protein n=1 Tax=Alteromonas sediminis TaxID=2259342 RepID=A0A3N5YDB8_9ALTE|nr:VC2046/SO_2500 family protein [Alteromonas sediminis]RPJ67525.1 hypothetical protein DRW07_08405 [Alteromonas sediminis]